MPKNPNELLTQASFLKKAIVDLRKEPYRGIHSVYSGCNEAFRLYFTGVNKNADAPHWADPVWWVEKLFRDGTIYRRPARGGYMLYLPGEAPQRNARDRNGRDILGKMGLL